MNPDIAFKIHGNGPIPVIVLHDWYCDRTSWDATLPYLTPTRFTYAFADLRGYGASRDMAGAYTLEEASRDVVALADRLGWRRFSLIGHSMSGLVVQRVAQIAPDRVARIVAVTPAPPASLGADAPVVQMFQALARASDDERFATMAPMWGNRLSETWIRLKLRRWRETAAPEAAAEYVKLWGCSDISAGAKGIKTPMLVIAAAQDAPPFRPEALEKSMMPYYPAAEMISLAESGHYPMQEQPPMLATLMERFLG